MAGAQDINELLRVLVSRKVTMASAMAHVGRLQAAGLMSIGDVAAADAAAVEASVGDPQLAHGLQHACIAHLKGKRKIGSAGVSGGAESRKKRKLQGALDNIDDPERLLALPLSTDETRIQDVTLFANRAPLLLAFALELLRVTMPGQPPSSQLSLAQAVVRASAKAKAISLGIQRPVTDNRGIWAPGQPSVRLLGRDIPVLKRGSYEWKRESGVCPTAADKADQSVATEQPGWVASKEVVQSSSRFVVHVMRLKSESARAQAIGSLLGSKPHLKSATHNAWVCRVDNSSGPTIEDSFDDGESGCGQFYLKCLREFGASNVVVVMSRWFGGVLLGPDRWGIMRACLQDALSRLSMRPAHDVSMGSEPLWALDLDEMARPTAAGDRPRDQPVEGAAIHSPETARSYLLKSFALHRAPGAETTKKPSARDGCRKVAGDTANDLANNLGLLLGAIRLLMDSWSGVLTARQLDDRAWQWYTRVRPSVDGGPSGWGSKGTISLKAILDLRKADSTESVRCLN